MIAKKFTKFSYTAKQSVFPTTPHSLIGFGELLIRNFVFLSSDAMKIYEKIYSSYSAKQSVFQTTPHTPKKTIIKRTLKYKGKWKLILC